jgi:stage II sporulation protein D
MMTLHCCSRAVGILRRVAAGLLLALVVLTCLVSSTPVEAASGDFVFTGRGWGHGAGMSQWGAWQAAREGVTFDEILAFYYPGTTLTTISDPDKQVKVRISSEPWTSNTTDFVQVDLKPTVAPAILVKHTSSGDESETVFVGALVNVLNVDGRVQIVTADGSQGPFDYVELVPTVGEDGLEGRVAIQLKTSGKTVDYREYWGTIRVQYGDSANELWVNNYLPLEKYVRSIAEVDYDWAMPGSAAYAPEAVKAQAVAARTYAVAKNSTLADNQNDQCYRGYTFEAKYPGIAQAAEETAGQVLAYQGKAISAFYSAHSGGYTTNSPWSGTTPAYIVSQPDPWSLRAPPLAQNSAGPGYNWTYAISPAALSAKVNGHLKDSTTLQTVNVGLLKRVEIVARDTSDPESHAKTLRLTGEGGIATVTATSFRALFGYSVMRSTLILSITGGEPLAEGEFYDIGPNHLYHDEIARVFTSGLMGGYEGGLFRPDGSITRWQFAKISVTLHNLMYPDDQITVVDVNTSPYQDVPLKVGTLGDESDWLAAAKKAGLVSGVTPTAFKPYTILCRDEMAAMMCRALGWMDEAASLPVGTPGFSDVPAAGEYWAPATYLKEQGILLGYADPSDPEATLLRVDEAIKRQHMAVILCRVLDQAGF